MYVCIEWGCFYGHNKQLFFILILSIFDSILNFHIQAIAYLIAQFNSYKTLFIVSAVPNWISIWKDTVWAEHSIKKNPEQKHQRNEKLLAKVPKLYEFFTPEKDCNFSDGSGVCENERLVDNAANSSFVDENEDIDVLSKPWSDSYFKFRKYPI